LTRDCISFASFPSIIINQVAADFLLSYKVMLA
jgi:hypothetical protein